MRIKNAMWALALGVFITACENDDNAGSEPVPSGDFVEGILVSNEGPFNNGTGTVNYISNDLVTETDAIFNQVNNADLGNVVQSIAFTEASAYVVANVSNKITVVNRFTFEQEAEITAGLSNPRYFVSVNGKGYVTNWGDTADETDDYIAIINLTNNTVEGTIPVTFGPELLVVQSTDIYVAHKGAFGNNTKVSVIDTNTESVTTTIDVAFTPNGLQLDANDNLWVLSGGKPAFTGEETGGALAKINTASNTVDFELNFEDTEHPNNLSIDGNTLYYDLAGSVYGLSTTATSLPDASEFSDLSVYEMTAKDGRLYLTDAKDFASNGDLSIYDLTTKELIASFEVGIVPGGIYFN